MSRRSKRELERALDRAEEDTVNPDKYEIIITDHIVETPHPTETQASVEKTRVWGEKGGEWHSEEIDADADVVVDEEEDCDPEA